MRNHKAHILFSATDLNGHIECDHRTFLNLKNLETPLPKKKKDAHGDLLSRKGLEHEAAYLLSLKTAGQHVVEIPANGFLEDRARTTLEAMKSGAAYISQAALLKAPWHGFADLLRRVERPSSLGPYSYEAVDIKLSRHPEPSHIIQLCVYSDLLEHYQGVAPQFFSIILGKGDEQHFQFSDFAQYYMTLKRQFEAYVATSHESLTPSPCTFCSKCQWQDICDEQWKKDDHMSQIANIQKTQIVKLENNNIRTLESLALLSDETSVPKLAEQTLTRLKSQARLQYAKRETGENQLELLPAVEGRGFARLPKPDPADLFFDMEGDPLYIPDGLEYLFGFYFFDNGNPVFKPFWAHDKEEEKRTFQEVIDFVTSHLNQHPGAHIYHYNQYEETAIKRLASRFGTREAGVDNILRGRKLVDLFKVVRDSIRTSEPGYSIKNLETFYMDKREGAVGTATESIVVYDQWRSSGNDAFLKQISDYNEDDCRSTYLLQQWLLKLRPADTRWFELENETVPEEKRQTQTEKEIKREQYEKALLNDATDLDLPFWELIAHLLEFHRREDKPTWWNLFERQEKDPDELIEDLECLAGLTLSLEQPPHMEKRSKVYTYHFPPQEHKLTVGKQWSLINPLKNIGTIFSLDNDNGIVQLKTTSPSLPKCLSITHYPIFKDDVLKQAIYRFADTIISKTNRYPAIGAFLKREIPQINDQEVGTPIIGKGSSIIDAAIKAVSNLQNSYLFIQGPPGAGKTLPPPTSSSN